MTIATKAPLVIDVPKATRIRRRAFSFFMLVVIGGGIFAALLAKSRKVLAQGASGLAIAVMIVVGLLFLPIGAGLIWGAVQRQMYRMVVDPETQTVVVSIGVSGSKVAM